jgi:starch synthase
VTTFYEVVNNANRASGSTLIQYKNSLKDIKLMEILFVSSEVEPFAKTGGLADVCGALPHHIARLGGRIAVIMPLYRETRARLHSPAIAAEFPISAGTHSFAIQVLSERSPADVPVYFVRCDELFDREGIYETDGRPFADNPLRFICFSRAVLAFCRTTGRQPDIMHLNDWQSALIPAFLIDQSSHDPLLHRCATVMTIHNMAYQGMFPADVFDLTGLGRAAFWHPGQLEFWGDVNFLKAGIVNADMVSTVSPTYAREITTPEFGCGLETVLATRSRDLVGILNGADYDIWNPQTDPLIAARYDSGNLTGKQECKRALLKRFSLDPALMQRPLIGCISRLVDQKGFDLIEKIFEDLMKTDAGFVLLGTGEQRYHAFFARMAQQHQGRVGVLLAYDNTVAHEIEAGCDLFAMPSRFEPCGLTQIYSLKYGAVPIVRATGGLADTIIDIDRDPVQGNGFSFEAHESSALLDALIRALACYRQKERWQMLIQRCMACNFSWDVSARAYVDLYRSARDRKMGIGG